MINLPKKMGSIATDFAISMRWTALEPANIYKAIFIYYAAQNLDELRQAVTDFSVPAQNMIFADIEGNIAYQTPGNIPVREPGHRGDYPAPGWTDEYEWLGYIPFNQLPSTFNPPDGFIVTANNAIVGTDYVYELTAEDYGFRAARIVQLIKSSPGPIDAAYIQMMHGDNYDASATYMVPLLMQLSLQDENLIE
jgi:penicillin amidase